MKKCSKCGLEKPVTEFYETSRTRKDGTRYRLPSCKACYAAYYAQNSERQKKSNRRAKIKRQYGLTLEKYEELIAQGCAACGSTDKVVMDHCHASGALREPLCNGCNVALGAAKDSPDTLRKLADYLERHAAR